MSSYTADHRTVNLATIDLWIEAKCYIAANGIRVCHITQTSRQHTVSDGVMVIPCQFTAPNGTYGGCFYADVMPYNYWTYGCYRWGGAPSRRIIVVFDRSVHDVLDAIDAIVRSHARRAASAIAEMGSHD